jgi:hypothetical protein
MESDVAIVVAPEKMLLNAFSAFALLCMVCLI